MRSQKRHHATRVAVIGMAGRFPGSRDVAQFWQNLCDGVESITQFSEEDLRSAGIEASEFEKPNYVRAGSPIEDVDMFDASFFGINPREAESMDPQQRIFLECAWQALEDAGYDPKSYPGLIGVYAGCSMSTYLRELERHPEFVNLVGHLQVLIGNDKDYLTTHASYKLDLKGPSVSIQTTCCTSLVAVSLACKSLQVRDCDMALAGGICVHLPQKAGYAYEPGGIFSPDGHCRVFDAKAQGVVFGNGVGLVLLKRLEDAIRDKDAIYAVILGSAINNDGAVKSSYTAPGLEGQTGVILAAHDAARTDPSSVTYIEAHGTGTSLGDPIEIGALTRAFRLRGHHGNRSCAIGSVKTNVGHLDHAAGVTGLIKTVLSLKNKTIPPSINCDTPNPQIAIEDSPFYINTKLTEWKTNRLPRRAGVSAFGIGGTNVHMILEEAPAARNGRPSRPAQIVLLSARTNAALETATSNIASHLASHPEIDLSDVAYTCHVGRRAFPWRRAVIAKTSEDAAKVLGSVDSKRILSSVLESRSHSIVFMFSGQGAQYVNMGRQLYETEPTFRDHVDHCSAMINHDLGIDLRDLLYPKSQEEDASSRLAQTRFTQPALFVIEYALAMLLMEWGIRPRAMIGHSIGEYLAACIAGCMPLESALRVVVERARLMQQAPSGSMLAIPLSEEETRRFLTRDLEIATINQESMCVVAGPTSAIEALQRRLTRADLTCHRLHTSHAFHSHMMDCVLEPFGRFLRGVELKPPQISYVSNVTGSWITPNSACSPDYWAKHLREPVRFDEGIRTLLREHNGPFIEIGPGQTLASFVRQNSARREHQSAFTTIRHPQAPDSDSEFLLTTVTRLWLSGVEVDWAGFHRHEQLHRVHLPTYPFERQRYWVSTPAPEVPIEPPRKRTDPSDWFYVPSWVQSGAESLVPKIRSESQSCWLIFEDDCGLGTELARCVREQGEWVVTVRAGERFAATSEFSYEIDPLEGKHYADLIADLRSRNRFPAQVAHLWSVSGAGAAPAEEAFDEQQVLGLYSLLFLAQAFIAQRITDPIQIGFVSDQVQCVTGEEQLAPGKATALGACKSIPQEYPNLRFHAIDIDVQEAGQPLRELAERLATELKSGCSSVAVAYRGDQRWVEVFEPTRLGPSDAEIRLLRKRGVYLITGGLGNIGLVAAEELAKAAQARVVLLGRREFPPREAWKRWVAEKGESDSISRKIARLSAIEESGGEVLVVRADICNENDLQEAVNQVYGRFGSLHGVIHGAGNVSSEGFFAVDLANPTLCERQFAAKVRGLLILERLLRGESLDFWLLLSSISSVLAGLGYAAYSAANIFLDSFAAQRSLESGIPWVSVNWDSWNFSEPAEADSASLALLPQEGGDALRRILCWSPLPQVVVSVGDLETRLDQWIRQQSSRGGAAKHDADAHLYMRPNTGTPYIAPRNGVERAIAEVWQDVLGIKGIGIYDNFFSDLSGSSLLATQLLARLRSMFPADLPLRRFFEGPTVSDLAVAVQPPIEEPHVIKPITSAKATVLQANLAETERKAS